MPRKKTFRTADYPYHVTARSSNKEWFYLPKDQVWEIFMNYLWFVTLTYKVRVHAFVLMDNHFHLLIRTPEANIDEAMNYLLREVSKTIGIESGRQNQIFGGPYHWSVIKNSIYYHHAYKYIYRNPVHAGICWRVEDYPYSTLKGLLGRDQVLFPVADNMCLISDPYRQLEWLNKDFESDDQIAIRTALRHREFSFPKDPSTGRQHHLESKVV